MAASRQPCLMRELYFISYQVGDVSRRYCCLTASAAPQSQNAGSLCLLAIQPEKHWLLDATTSATSALSVMCRRQILLTLMTNFTLSKFKKNTRKSKVIGQTRPMLMGVV